jgi:transposase
MDYLGLDIAKANFNAALITATQKRHARFANSEAGFAQLLAWLAGHRPQGGDDLHACMEATGNWGLDLAGFLVEAGITVSIVNPRQVKAFGESELSRNKTDKLDAALIARFCHAHTPRPWTPPLPEMRELREMVRRCAALKVSRVQEINRQKAGLASASVALSIERMLAHLDAEIAAVTAGIQAMIARNAELQASFALLCTIPGLGEVTAAVILAELPNITEFTPKALAAFAGLSPQEDSSGNRRVQRGISRIGNARLRAALFMCALSARRHNPALKQVVQRMTSAAKPNKVVLVAVARRLLVFAHAVLRSQQPFRAQGEPA